MSAENLIVTALIIEAVVLSISLLALILHAVFYRIKKRAFRRGSLVGQQVLTQLGTATDADQIAGQLEYLPYRVKVHLITSLAYSIERSHSGILHEIAENLGIIHKAERQVRSIFWWKRLEGLRILTELGGGENSVPSLFNDKYTIIRAQSMDWATKHPTPDIVEALIAIITSAESGGRFPAKEAVLRMSTHATPHIVRYLHIGSQEGIREMLDIAVHLASPSYLEIALTLSSNPDKVIRAKSLDLLGAIGGQDATEVLIRSLGDSYALARSSSARALGTIGHWRAAPHLFPLLRDTSWEVRREAAMALKSMGNPGKLYLKKALSDSDRFASDMAKQILELPE